MTLFLASWDRPGALAVERARAARQSNCGLIECLEQGLAACELDPDLLAIGLGSLPNRDGELELDAAMMEGRGLQAGGVCALRGIVPAISVARRVLERTKHIMLAGDNARRFAIEEGFEVRQTMTERSVRLYEEWRATGAHDQYLHSVDDLEHIGDTVTMLGLEAAVDGPHLVAASSTSGISWKIPGRVGDSPIFGAGLYADDEVGAAGATGHGEELWKACASFRVVEAMRQGVPPQEACEATIRHIIRRHPRGLELPSVVFALRRDGQFGAAVTKGTFQLWIDRDEGREMRVFHGLHSA